MTRVLVVDGDLAQLHLTAETVQRVGFKPLIATSGEQALAILRDERKIGAVLLELTLSDLSGMGVLEAMHREGHTAPVIMLAKNASFETVITIMRNGAADYLIKPVAPERLFISLHNAMKLDVLEATIRAEHTRRNDTFAVRDMIGSTAVMSHVLSRCLKAAKSAIPLLIEGESGVGKELVARIIHGSGDRAGKPFVAVNCGSIAPCLIEAVLFGYREGVFTGAVSDLPGKLAEAHSGTLFLDEVGELPLDIQSKLLRVLQEGVITPVGASHAGQVDIRIISATSRRLLNLAKTGAFREDLYSLLNVFPIYVPPLRERMEDIPALVTMFVARFAAEVSKRVAGISPSALELLMRYDWPGNIRQLENAVYRAVVLTGSAFLETADFPQIVAQIVGRGAAVKAIEAEPVLFAPIHIDTLPGSPCLQAGSSPVRDRFLDASGKISALADIERDAIIFAIEHHGGRMSCVARALGIGRSTLYRKLHEYRLVGPFANAA